MRPIGCSAFDGTNGRPFLSANRIALRGQLLRMQTGKIRRSWMPNRRNLSCFKSLGDETFCSFACSSIRGAR